ncbi:hypothetical protein GFH30_10015 [Acinetobacter wanghuae]|uniref:Conjugal transfer protein TrbI n=1 Tax=Acinetobacter wanghuae TaxID=2662362 RepID=A0A5Q0P4Z3_9GAMM|nr:hypothetical protein [Acinetobacter wanghuae]MQW91403.1 hypothetical protein [Acinetobacter wanghuae]QGA11693.1 hypothetical protein GFH30_10015 [Acinetobacter wanghuae]
MVDDLNKTSPSHRPDGVPNRKRIPVYILIVVGIFLLAVLLYMFADMKPSRSDAPPGHPNPDAQPATMNSTTTGAPGDEKRASQ